MGGRDQSERLVAINRNSWSRSSGARTNGAPLPSWLHFDPTIEAFTGLMPNGTQAVAINVTATNKSSLSASETFVLSIAQSANQFGQAIAGTTAGANGSEGALTFLPSPQDHFTHLAMPAHA
jgi:Putative Ig domain